MRFGLQFLETKVARRIFLLFFLCAMLPVAGLAVVSYVHVTRQLERQSGDELRRASKAFGMSLVERLLFVEAEMRRVLASRVEVLSHAVEHGIAVSSEASMIRSWSVVPIPGEETRALTGRGAPSTLTADEKSHLAAGRSLLVAAPGSEEPQIFMGRALEPGIPERGIAWVEIEPDYLWATTGLALWTKVCIVGEVGVLLHCPAPAGSNFGVRSANPSLDGPAGDFEWSDRGRDFRAGYWLAFLRPSFLAPSWTVVLSEPRSRIMAPVASFKRSFPLVILLGLLIVLYLSRLEIARCLEPVAKLKEGTQRIARCEFESPVAIASGDEFEELGDSFNNMARQLDRQFQALLTVSEIDRSILAALDSGAIVNEVLRNAGRIVPATAVSVTLVDPAADHAGYAHFVDGDGTTVRRYTRLAPEDVRDLRENTAGIRFDARDRRASAYGHSVSRDGERTGSCLALPILLDGQLSGAIVFRGEEGAGFDEDDLTYARRLTDQVAVALSQARLLEDLEQLNLGTVKALAGAIDAKSEWTSGHSERVTALSLAIGRQLGLAPIELTALERGALLHDIGKIGVPSTILDKPALLNPEEFGIIQEHVRLGVRIIEPIHQYAEILPMILQHHERLDGSGYPQGLKGDEICTHARILAVADCYDAITTHRPYREGLSPEEALEVIRGDAPTELDPLVVESLARALERVRAPA